MMVAAPRRTPPQRLATPARASGDRIETPLAERIAVGVRRVPGVAVLHGGPFGVVATHLPGGDRLIGVRLDGGAVDVHLTAVWPTQLIELGERVRRAVVGVAGAREVHVTVEDLAPAGRDTT